MLHLQAMDSVLSHANARMPVFTEAEWQAYDAFVKASLPEHQRYYVQDESFGHKMFIALQKKGYSITKFNAYVRKMGDPSLLSSPQLALEAYAHSGMLANYVPEDKIQSKREACLQAVAAAVTKGMALNEGDPRTVYTIINAEAPRYDEWVGSTDAMVKYIESMTEESRASLAIALSTYDGSAAAWEACVNACKKDQKSFDQERQVCCNRLRTPPSVPTGLPPVWRGRDQSTYLELINGYLEA